VFVELHAQSAFTFLEGAEQPETLASEAARLGLPAIALVDRDGVYGAARFHRAAENAGVRAIVGSELTLADGSRLPVLVEDRDGYRNLCRLVTRLKLGAPKGAGRLTLDDLAPYAGGLVCLTGGRQGPLAGAVARGDRAAARGILDRLAGIFGRDGCFVEVQRHLDRAQERDLGRLVTLARAARLPLVAANQPLYARAGGRAVADVFTCIREKTELDRAGRRLAANGSATCPRRSPPPASWRCAWGSRSSISAIAFPSSRCRPASPRSSTCVSWRWPERAAVTATARWPPVRAGRSRTSWTSSGAWTSPATSSSCGTSSNSAAPATSSCRDAARPPTAPCVTRWASPPWIRWGWTCCSSASSPRREGSGRTSISIFRAANDAKPPSSTCTGGTAATALA
jgi:hypothetical protein